MSAQLEQITPPALEWEVGSFTSWEAEGRLGTLYRINVADEGEEDDTGRDVAGKFIAWRQIGTSKGTTGILNNKKRWSAYGCLCEAKRACEEFDARDGKPIRR